MFAAHARPLTVSEVRMPEPQPPGAAANEQLSLAPVMLLEDAPYDSFFVRRAFERARIANPILGFVSAQEARCYLEEARLNLRPALLILDITLDGCESGLTFLRWVRQQRLPLGSTPVMMLTASTSREDQDAAALLGSIYFLSKPVTDESLIEAVHSLGCLVTSESARHQTIERL
jgi:CheY-like chemotaxis protein